MLKFCKYNGSRNDKFWFEFVIHQRQDLKSDHQLQCLVAKVEFFTIGSFWLSDSYCKNCLELQPTAGAVNQARLTM